MSLGWMEDQLLVYSKWHICHKYACTWQANKLTCIFYVKYIQRCTSAVIRYCASHFNAKIYKKNQFLLGASELNSHLSSVGRCMLGGLI